MHGAHDASGPDGQKAGGFRIRAMKWLVVLLAVSWIAAVACCVSGVFARSLFGPVWSSPSDESDIDVIAGEYSARDQSLILRRDGSYELRAGASSKEVAANVVESGHWKFPKYPNDSRLTLELTPANGTSDSALTSGGT